MGLLSVSSRFMMVVMSSIFLAASAFLMFIGVKIIIFIGSIKDVVGNSYLAGPGAIMILLSLLCLVIGTLGYVGAVHKGKCVAAVFFLLLLLVFLMELTGIILSFVYKDEVATLLEDQMNKTIVNKYGNDPGVTNSTNSIQRTFQCCGVVNYSDWKYTTWGKEKKNVGKVPVSCCKKDKDKCTGDLSGIDDINQSGCQKKLINNIHRKLVWIIVFVVLFMLVQLVGLVCTCIRLRSKKKVPYQQLDSDTGSQGYHA